MRTRELISLPNHPIFPTITRKAIVGNMKDDSDNNTVQMTVNIYCYLDGEEVKDMFKQVPLVATNAIILNPQTFEKATPDEEGNYPEGSIGEYDLLFDLVKNKIKTIFELEDMYVQLRIDSINAKM
jgi:hypothetical protein